MATSYGILLCAYAPRCTSARPCHYVQPRRCPGAHRTTPHRHEAAIGTWHAPCCSPSPCARRTPAHRRSVSTRRPLQPALGATPVATVGPAPADAFADAPSP
uniref:Uncharacterized protein n=1 Tax=Arundo donax TaxID=35708 RepID=A0A0A9EBU4_ARUDO